MDRRKFLMRTSGTVAGGLLVPRLGFALLRAGPDGIDKHIISHQMVTDFTTSQGASVLSPNWDLINPMIKGIFGP